MKIRRHDQLEVIRKAMELAMSTFAFSKRLPKEETYSLIDRVRRSSRSVCANLAEAWRKRRYAAAFVAKLLDAESEAAETQVWIQFAVRCGYLDRATGADLYRAYDEVLRMLVAMINRPGDWLLTKPEDEGGDKAHGRDRKGRGFDGR